MNKLISTVRQWIPLAVALTGAFGFAYLVGQQTNRQLMNDPQIQIAEHAATTLSQGGDSADVVLKGSPIDIRTSLDVWTTVYDESGKPLQSSAQLDGAPPQMPVGLLDTSHWTPNKTWHAPSGLETRVSWQPREDTRQAVVIVHFDSTKGNGWVVVGRSMRLVEERNVTLLKLAFVGWVSTLLVAFIAVFIFTTL